MKERKRAPFLLFDMYILLWERDDDIVLIERVVYSVQHITDDV